MPTPMWVYREIAERHGVDGDDEEAVTEFFTVGVGALSEEQQRKIAIELLEFDASDEAEAGTPATEREEDQEPSPAEVRRQVVAYLTDQETERAPELTRAVLAMVSAAEFGIESGLEKAQSLDEVIAQTVVVRARAKLLRLLGTALGLDEDAVDALTSPRRED